MNFISFHFRLGPVVALVSLLLGASAIAGDPPNVLFIVSDDLTACLGSYGHKTCRTPHLDRLAAEGVRFNRAYCQYPVCGPSRASFMSGLYPNRTEMLGNNYALGSYRVRNPKLADHPSIGGFLRRNGYVSLRVSKIFHMGVPGGIESGAPGGDDPDSWDRAFNIMAPETASPGVLELLSPKRTHYGSNFARIIVPDGEELTQADYLAASQAIAILETRARVRVLDAKRLLRPKQPFFLAVGFVRPHVPSVAPKRLFDHYPEKRMKLPHVPEGDLDDLPEAAKGKWNQEAYGMNEQQQRQARAAYFASVEFMDEQVGRLLDTLDRLDLRRNTVVIFTSDHGFNLGEHEMWQKLNLFEETVRVPLIVSAPGFEKSAGQCSDALVELIDLYPTIADLTGLAEAAPKNLDGRSLRPLLLNPARTDFRDAAYTVTWRNGESIRTDRWHYNRWGDDGEELYDRAKDPKEFNNLALAPEYESQLVRLRKLLARKRKQSQPQ